MKRGREKSLSFLLSRTKRGEKEGGEAEQSRSGKGKRVRGGGKKNTRSLSREGFSEAKK